MSSTESVVGLLQLLRKARIEDLQDRTVDIARLDINLAAITTAPGTPVAFNGRGFGLVVPNYNQTPGTALDVRVDGVSFTLMPGATMLTPFQRLEIFNTPQGANTGTALLYVLRDPDARLELGQLGSGSLQLATRTATQNVTNDIPALATEGVSLAGGKGARAVISAPVGQTITSGTGVWWLWDDVTGIWAEGVTQIDLSRTTARRAVSVPDEFVTVGRGRAFLEMRSVVTSGGGNLTVNTYAN